MMDQDLHNPLVGKNEKDTIAKSVERAKWLFAQYLDITPDEYTNMGPNKMDIMKDMIGDILIFAKIHKYDHKEIMECADVASWVVKN